MTTSKLVHKISLLGREYAETRQANRALANADNLSMQVFDIYPLLGCYMIVCSDMSELISLIRFPNRSVAPSKSGDSVRFGSIGWMDDVEHIAAKHINPVREAAARSIRISPFVIDNRPLHVISQPNFLTRFGQRVSKAEAVLNVARSALHAV